MCVCGHGMLKKISDEWKCDEREAEEKKNKKKSRTTGVFKTSLKDEKKKFFIATFLLFCYDSPPPPIQVINRFLISKEHSVPGEANLPPITSHSVDIEALQEREGVEWRRGTSL